MGTPALDKTIGSFVQLATLPTVTLIRAKFRYLWMTQRLCRIPGNKPLVIRWKDLHEMFGGELNLYDFKRKFPADLTAARIAYHDARIDEHPAGYVFRASLPPIPKTKLCLQ